MALVVPDVGEKYLLEVLLRGGVNLTDNMTLHLFNNNYTPVSTTSVFGYFTEASFVGYGGVTFQRNTWSSAITNGTGDAECSNATYTWTCTGGTAQTVYGYWIEEAVGRTLLWAEKFGTYRVVANGDILNLVPKFTLRSQ